MFLEITGRCIFSLRNLIASMFLFLEDLFYNYDKISVSLHKAIKVTYIITNIVGVWE